MWPASLPLAILLPSGNLDELGTLEEALPYERVFSAPGRGHGWQ